MTDRTPQQVDMTLDRVEQISAQNTANIAELQTYISQFVRAVAQQHQDHEARMFVLEESQRDMKELLRLLVERTTGS